VLSFQILAFSLLRTIILSLDKEIIHFSLLMARTFASKIKGTSHLIENTIRSLIHYTFLMSHDILSRLA